MTDCVYTLISSNFSSVSIAITSCSQQKCPTHIEQSVFRTHLSLLYKQLANHSKAYGNDPLIAANISVTAIMLEDAFTLKQVLRNTSKFNFSLSNIDILWLTIMLMII
jgi:hypothetical protein